MLRALVLVLSLQGMTVLAEERPVSAMPSISDEQLQASHRNAIDALKASEALMQDRDFRERVDGEQRRAQKQELTETHSLVSIPNTVLQNRPPLNIQDPNEVEPAKSADRMTPVVLVSLSMPPAALKSLAQETGRLDTGIIFRGLKANSFVQMRQAFFELDNLSAQIDPTCFLRYSITDVPAFILPLEPVPLCTDDGCPAGRFVKVSGLMSLESALEFIARNSSEKEARSLAEKWLSQLRERP